MRDAALVLITEGHHGAFRYSFSLFRQACEVSEKAKKLEYKAHVSAMASAIGVMISGDQDAFDSILKA